MPEQRGAGVKSEELSRRRFIAGLPIAAAVAAGVLVSVREEVDVRATDLSDFSKKLESSLTCLARIERVERYDHTNYTNGVPWNSWEIHADCMAFDGFNKEFPLHLYYCFLAERDGEEEETAHLLAVLRPGVVLVASGCVSFYGDGGPPTIYDARLRDRTA